MEGCRQIGFTPLIPATNLFKQSKTDIDQLFEAKQNKPFIRLMRILLNNCPPQNVIKLLEGAISLEACCEDNQDLVDGIKRIAEDFFKSPDSSGRSYLEVTKKTQSLLKIAGAEKEPIKKIDGLKYLLLDGLEPDEILHELDGLEPDEILHELDGLALGEILYEQVLSLLKQKNYKGAVELYLTLVADNKGSAEEVFSLICKAMGKGTLEEQLKPYLERNILGYKVWAAAKFLQGRLFHHIEGTKGVTPDVENARRCYEIAEKAGIVCASNNLGFMHVEGHGVEEDHGKATIYYEKAAQAGNADALYNLGMNCCKVREYKNAEKYLIQAANAGNASALSRLGTMYDDGQGVVQDCPKAMTYYEKALKAGCTAALHHIGYMYGYGRGVTQDYAIAKKYYEQAVEKGNAGAMHNLGYMYEHSHGVKQDYPIAKKYYEQAAEAGCVASICRLANMHEKGLGVRPNLDKAKELYEQAEKKGSVLAMKKLGEVYLSGLVVGVDRVKAKEYFDKAAKAEKK